MGRDSVRYGDLYSQDHTEESERLEAIAATYDPSSQSRLAALGIGPETQCIDVGAGQGTIAGWLAERVAPAQVVALDRDTRLLQPMAQQHPNLKTITADICEPNLNPGVFDLVHCRFVLMHLPDRLELLPQLIKWVAPGGWAVFSDSIDLATPGSSHHAYRQVMDAHWKLIAETMGSDITWVRTYPDLLRQQGLVDIGMEVHLPSMDHRASAARFWQLTLTRMREMTLDRGLVEQDVYDHVLASLADPSFTDLSPGMISVWGRRPH